MGFLTKCKRFELEMASNFEDAQNVPDVTDPKDFIG